MLLGSPPDMIRGHPLRETGSTAAGGGVVTGYSTTNLPSWQAGNFGFRRLNRAARSQLVPRPACGMHPDEEHNVRHGRNKQADHHNHLHDREQIGADRGDGRDLPRLAQTRRADLAMAQLHPVDPVEDDRGDVERDTRPRQPQQPCKKRQLRAPPAKKIALCRKFQLQ